MPRTANWVIQTQYPGVSPANTPENDEGWVETLEGDLLWGLLSFGVVVANIGDVDLWGRAGLGSKKGDRRGGVAVEDEALSSTSER